MKRMMKNRRGDAVMVTSTLLLSLMLSAGATMLLDYGEIKGKEEDMLHVADVESSMLKARSAMMMLQQNGDMDMVVSTRITMGTYGNPYLAMGRSSGTLNYDPGYSGFGMGIYYQTGGSRTFLNGIRGQLTFESNNYYYRDQNLIFQSGSVIREEETTSMIAWDPSFEVYRGENSWSLKGGLYGLSGSRWEITGIDSVSISISLEGISRVERTVESGDSIVLVYDAEYTDAWESWWSSFARVQGLDPVNDISITRPSGPTGPLEVELITLSSFIVNIAEMELII